MIEGYFTPGFVIKRASVVNSGGLETKTFAAIATIPGAMRPLAARFKQVNEKLNYSVTHCFYCGIMDIQEGDIIIEDNKNYYEVRAIIDPMKMNKFLQVECEYNKDFQEC